MLRAALQCARRTTARGARWRCDAPAVSARGVAAPRLLPTYLADARGVAMYDAQMSPDGVLQLSVAENQMIEDLLVPKLREVHPASDFERGQIYYQPTAGTAQCRTAVGAHLSRVLGRGEYEVDPERLVVGAGCNAVLENLLFTIADAGEAVLIPRPYYAAFEFDLAARARMAIVGVESGGGGDAASYYPTPDALEAAYARAASAGLAPRVLLLSSPNNPLGIVYPAEVLGACLDWAASKPNLHVVSDEIYAGSIFREGDGAPRWTSVLGVAAQAGRALGDRCHIVWALSKDFALSGMRVGALYTENAEILLPLQKLNDLCQISSTTQRAVSRLLSDTDSAGQLWAATFEAENSSRIRARYDRLTATLDAARIGYLPASAGLFVWIDLRPFLDPEILAAQTQTPPPLPPPLAATRLLGPADAAAESELYLRLIREFGLLLTPGASMRTEAAGFFRCVFTAASDEAFDVALERFARLGASPRR